VAVFRHTVHRMPTDMWLQSYSSTNVFCF